MMIRLSFALWVILGTVGLVRADAPPKPNVLVILADDLGYSDLGCYGGEISTPHLDALAGNGLRFAQFYNCARCCPTRAGLLTGVYPHQAGVGHMLESWQPPAYSSGLGPNTATIAERLGEAGYRCYHVGKWHVGGLGPAKATDPAKNHPLDRGFHAAYGAGGNYFAPKVLYRDREPIKPGADFYATDAFSTAAVDYLAGHDQDHASAPFFLHLCYTAPHFPLHAPADDVARYRGKYRGGWDELREKRFARQKELGLIPREAVLSPRHQNAVAWASLSNEDQDDWDLRMAVYAAMIDRMDRGIGRVLAELRRTGAYENTLILFLSDNGASAEFVDTWPNADRGHRPGSVAGETNSHKCLEVGWANAANTPFREHKMWVHEGGMRTPMIAHWPKGITKVGTITQAVGHVIDFVPTLTDAAGMKDAPEERARPLTPLEGTSLSGVFRGEPLADRTLCWEHDGNRAIRVGNWKLVAAYQGPWELHDLSLDPAETHNLADQEPERVQELAAAWQTWADRVGVIPWEQLPGALYKPNTEYQKNGDR